MAQIDNNKNKAMDNSSKFKCPVCGHYNGQTDCVCQQCGWIFILYPSVVPETIKQQEKRRLELSKAIYKKAEKLNEKESELRSKDLDLKNKGIELKEKSRALESKDLEIKRLKSNAEDKNGKVSSLEETIRQMTTTINEKNRLQSVLEKEIDQLKYKLASKVNTESQKVVGIVYVKNILSGVSCYIPVYNGINTYGSAPDNANHHEVKLRTRGLIMQPQHFEVFTQNGRIAVRDLSSGSMTLDGQSLPKNGMYVNSSHTISIKDILEINISLI